MAHPTWVAYSFAVIMVSVSVYCVCRLVLARSMGRRNHNDVNVGHVLMGVAMVGMLVPRWNVIPDGLWETAFAVLALWFAAMAMRPLRRSGFRRPSRLEAHQISHYAIHVVMSCAMLYMYWLGMPITASSSATMAMSGPPSGAGDPLLTLLLIAVLVASAIGQLDAIGQFAVVQPAAGVRSTRGGAVAVAADVQVQRCDQPLLAPRLEVACHIAMCLTMGYMLILMV